MCHADLAALCIGEAIGDFSRLVLDYIKVIVISNGEAEFYCSSSFYYDGRRRLGVPGRELYVEPIFWGVDRPDRGNRANPKKGESIGVAGRELDLDWEAIRSSL